MRLNWSFLSQSHSIWGRTTNKALIWKGLKQSSLANLEFPGAWSYDFSLWSGRNWSYPGIVLAVGPVPNSTNRIVNYSKCLSFTNSKQNINVCSLDKVQFQFGWNWKSKNNCIIFYFEYFILNMTQRLYYILCIKFKINFCNCEEETNCISDNRLVFCVMGQS